MGLLGDSWDDPKTQATLQLAAGLLSGGNFGQALGKGLSGYQQTMQSAKEDKLRDELMQWKRDEQTQAMQERQRKIDLQKLIQKQFSPVSGTDAISVDASGPTVEKANLVGQRRTPDYQALLAAGASPELVRALAESPNYGVPEVARTAEVEGANGQKMIQGFDKFGRPVGQAVSGYMAPVQVNQGDKISFVKPSAGVSLPMGMSPDAKASNAVAWANNRLAGERLAFDKAGGVEAVNGEKPQFKDGNWVMPPKNMQPGTSVPAVPQQGVKDATEALALIKQAEELIPSATGSGVGAGLDFLGRGVGYSSKGDTAIGQLKAIEGALVAKMPKMSGPQSDKDVALYKQMAGEVGDPMIPKARKLAALETIKEIQQRYAGIQPKPLAPAGQLGSGSFRILSVE